MTDEKPPIYPPPEEAEGLRQASVDLSQMVIEMVRADVFTAKDVAAVFETAFLAAFAAGVRSATRKTPTG